MSPPSFSMRFPCSRRYAGRARRSLTAYLASLRLDGRLEHEITMAVGEAIANAIEHGYPDAKFFEIRCFVKDDAVVAEVEDDGPGFRGDPVQPPPGASRGFGFGIMRSLADELHILKNGRLIRLVKRLAAQSENERQQSS